MIYYPKVKIQDDHHDLEKIGHGNLLIKSYDRNIKIQDKDIGLEK